MVLFNAIDTISGSLQSKLSANFKEAPSDFTASMTIALSFLRLASAYSKANSIASIAKDDCYNKF